MGKYINQTSNGFVGASAIAKLEALIEDGAKVIHNPTEWEPNLVCVVDNGPFGAAAYCDSPSEFKRMTYSGDPRPKRWLIWDKVEMFAE